MGGQTRGGETRKDPAANTTYAERPSPTDRWDGGGGRGHCETSWSWVVLGGTEEQLLPVHAERSLPVGRSAVRHTLLRLGRSLFEGQTVGELGDARF